MPSYPYCYHSEIIQLYFHFKVYIAPKIKKDQKDKQKLQDYYKINDVMPFLDTSDWLSFLSFSYECNHIDKQKIGDYHKINDGVKT